MTQNCGSTPAGRSDKFARLGDSRPVGVRALGPQALRTPPGREELDCDALVIPGDDQVLVVYSAAPGGPDADSLALLRVVGLTTPGTGFHDRPHPSGRPG